MRAVGLVAALKVRGMGVTYISPQVGPALGLEVPHHCPQCTGKHLPEPAWHCEYEDALWTPVISSPCHLGSGPPPLLPGCPRPREMASHLAPVSLSPKLGPFCSLILLATIILYRNSKEKNPPHHPSIHLPIYPTIHSWRHLSSYPSI